MIRFCEHGARDICFPCNNTISPEDIRVNKLQQLMKETTNSKDECGTFGYSLTSSVNKQNLKELKLIVIGSARYLQGVAKETVVCKPIDLANTINDLSGRLLKVAVIDNFEKVEAAKKAKAAPKPASNSEPKKAEAPKSKRRSTKKKTVAKK